MLTALCYRWEFFTTLDFEWEIFTGRRPWRWSFIVYLTARLLALMATVCELVGFNLTSTFDCNVSIPSVIPFFLELINLILWQVWFRLLLFASWFAVAVASFLLALRG